MVHYLPVYGVLCDGAYIYLWCNRAIYRRKKQTGRTIILRSPKDVLYSWTNQQIVIQTKADC